MEIILASASPRRSDILGRRGIPFRVLPAQDVDESAVSGTASEVARELARRKADSVLSTLPGAQAGPGTLVIGADTVVEVDGLLLGKPRTRDDSRSMLGRLAGRTHRVITGIAVGKAGDGFRVEDETSEVIFRALTAEEIEAYIDTGDPEGKAGAYGIQSGGRGLVAGFRGCYYNIVGLPVERLLRMLQEAGFESHGATGSCDCRAHSLWRGGQGCLPAVKSLAANSR